MHTGCENWGPLTPLTAAKLGYGANLAGTDGRGAKAAISTSGCAAGTTGTIGELLGTYGIPAAVGTAAATDTGVAKDGQKIFAPGLSLNSCIINKKLFQEIVIIKFNNPWSSWITSLSPNSKYCY